MLQYLILLILEGGRSEYQVRPRIPGDQRAGGAGEVEGVFCLGGCPLPTAPRGDFTQPKLRSAPESSSLSSSSSSPPVLQERDVLTAVRARLQLLFNGHAQMTSAGDLPAPMVCLERFSTLADSRGSSFCRAALPSAIF